MSPRPKCNEQCPRSARDGPKINCTKCKTLCHLQCFDFESGETINGMETVKYTPPNGTVITTFVATLGFACCTNTMSASAQKAALKMPTVERGSSKGRQSKSIESDKNDALVTEMKLMKDLLMKIKDVTDANTVQIEEMKKMSTTTEASVKVLSEKSDQNQMMNTPGRALSYVDAFKRNAFAKANRSPNGTPSRKRARNDVTNEPKPNYPQPKMGTKSNVTGLSVVPKRETNRYEKPKFEKAIWISRLSPTVSEEQLIDFITKNTPVTEEARMCAHKLVKKDTDVSLLNFVSFKIELNAEDFDVLNDPAVWPENVMVREFMQPSKRTLGNFLPILNGNQSNAPELMDTHAAS